MLQWLTQEHSDKSMVHNITKCLRAVAEMVRMAEKTFIISIDCIHHSSGGCCVAQFEDTAHDGPEKFWLRSKTPRHGKFNY